MSSSDVDIAKSRDRIDSHDPESVMTAAPLAYRSGRFLDSEEGRPVRILAEYLAPLGAFMRDVVEAVAKQLYAIRPNID